MLALVALWGVPALLRTHGEFFAVGLGRHVVGRSFGTMQGHGGSPIGALAWLPFYFVTVFVSFAPWSIKIPWLTRRVWRERDVFDIYLISGVAVVFVIFTIVKTKLPHYILPAFPLLALLLVRHWLQLERAERSLRRWSLATAVIMLALALVGTRMLAPYFPAPALFEKAEPFLQSEMDFAAYDFDAASLVWSFRSRVKGFMHYNRIDERDVATLQPDQIAPFLAGPGPHFVVLPTEVANRLFPTLPNNYRTFSVRGIDIAKVGVRFDPARRKVEWKGLVDLTLILKNT